MAYSYLDGSQTGSLLSGQPVNSVPSNYIPGQGTAPYSPLMGTNSVQQGATQGASQPPGLAQAIQGAMSGNRIDMPRLQRILGYSNQQMDQLTQSGQLQSYIAPYNSGSTIQNKGTLSTYSGNNVAGAASAGASGTTNTSGFPIIGQQSPEEAARNAAIMNAPIDRSVQGGTSSGGSGDQSKGGSGTTSPSDAGGGLGLGSGGVGQPSNQNPSFSPTQYSPGQPLTFNPPQNITPQSGPPGSLDMHTASPQDALSQYQNTAGYQLLNAPGAYQQSPGYQFAVNDAMKQVQQNASSRGLLDSGNAMQSMLDRAQGMALQDYGNWWTRQSQQFNDYQNRLAGLAGGQTGGDQANALGQAQAQNNALTGSNLGSLFGNQGTAGLGGITGTAAAQANSINQAANQTAQVNAANQSTQLAGAVASQQQQNTGRF